MSTSHDITDNIGAKVTKEPTPDLASNQSTINRWLDHEVYFRYNVKSENEAEQNTFVIHMGEFLDILRTTGPHCWFEDAVIDLAFAQLTDNQKRSDCYVLPTSIAQQFCQYDLGNIEADFLDVNTISILSDKRKRWIIVPCSDGMLENNYIISEDEERRVAQKETDNSKSDVDKGVEVGQAEKAIIPEDVTSSTSSSRHEVEFSGLATSDKDTQQANTPPANDGGCSSETEASEASKEKSQDSSKVNSRRALGHGAHWGLMVIDTQTQTARWLDGLVGLGTKNKDGKRTAYVKVMLNAGAAAGHILRGYEKILGGGPGMFTTSTLKWVPHQSRDNQGPYDEGACGPYIFACLKHIFEHPGALDDLYAHFKGEDSSSGEFRRKGRGFNSTTTRKEMSDQVKEEREREEQNPELSLRLTPELMDILGLQITPERLLQAVRKFELRANNIRPSTLPSDFKPDSVLLNEFRQAKIDNPGNYEGLDDRAALNLYIMMQQSQLDVHRKGRGKAKGIGASNEGPNKTVEGCNLDIYVGRALYHNVPLDDTSIWPQHETDRSFWPRQVTELPDFANIHKNELTQWLYKNKDIRDEKHDEVRSRAMLHVKFKKTFLGEPDANFRDVWSLDRTVLDPKDLNFIAMKRLRDDRMKYGEMRLLMMQRYEAETVKSLLKALLKYKAKTPVTAHKRGDDDDDESDDNDNGGDGKGSKGKGNKGNGKKGSSREGLSNADPSGSGSGGTSNKPTDGNQASKNKTKDKDCTDNDITIITTTDDDANGWDRPHPKPHGLLDFPNMTQDELERHITPKMRQDPRVTSYERNGTVVEPNTFSWRALCFVDHADGRFEHESDSRCVNAWIRDSMVFEKGAWEVGHSPQFIRDRMMAHYERKGGGCVGEAREDGSMGLGEGGLDGGGDTEEDEVSDTEEDGASDMEVDEAADAEDDGASDTEEDGPTPSPTVPAPTSAPAAAPTPAPVTSVPTTTTTIGGGKRKSHASPSSSSKKPRF